MPEDIIAASHGTIVIFYPLTTEVVEWIERNVEVPDYMRLTSSNPEAFAADHRPAASLVGALEAAGFEVGHRTEWSEAALNARPPRPRSRTVYGGGSGPRSGARM